MKEKLNNAYGLIDKLYKTLRILENDYNQSKKNEEELYEHYRDMLTSPKGRYGIYETKLRTYYYDRAKKEQEFAENNLENFIDELEKTIRDLGNRLKLSKEDK